jgi:two-component system nitrogen regulation sensor histidine kinase NtrY
VAAPVERRPFRDNPRLILAGIAVLVAIIVGLVVAEGRVSTLAPDLLAEGVLYALTVTNFTMLLALLFLLGRNVIKSLIEGRRRLPFARFRAKLVLMMLGLTVVPALLVLLVGSRVVLTTVDRWFATPMDDILASANGIAADYYAERQQNTRAQARRLAQRLAAVSVDADVTVVREAIQQDAGPDASRRVDVFRADTSSGATELQSAVSVGAGRDDRSEAAAEPMRLARQALEGASDGPWVIDPGRDGAEWLRVAEPVARNGRVSGVVVVSERLSGGLAQRAKRLTAAYEDYSQLRALRQPLAGVYLSFFIMATLLILVGSSWVGLYLAKRITRPVQALSLAAREMSAGHYHQRIQIDASDEFAGMVDAFNAMAADVAQSRQQLEAAGRDLAQQHADGERRRRYIETVVERIAAGVVSIDREGGVTTVNRAAQRLLSLESDVVGTSASVVFGQPALEPLSRLLSRRTGAPADTVAGEVQLMQDGSERHLSAVVTPLTDAAGTDDGCVLVVDDVTPLVRAQKVAAWREVARRLAHEIKNPLTPIQLSADRLRRQLNDLDPARDALVRECTSTITGEVESLKGLVDEFAQFARMPAPRVATLPVGRLFEDVLALYRGVVDGVRFEVQPGPDALTIKADPEQMKRVLINLVDNAIEAMDRQGVVWLDAVTDEAGGVVRVGVADNGPGLPASDREQLFLPYYSTKGRGSGLGLAIVRRIVGEHGGRITVADHQPRGTRFTIELPL